MLYSSYWINLFLFIQVASFIEPHKMRPIKASDGYDPFDENFMANRFDYEYSVQRNFKMHFLTYVSEVNFLLKLTVRKKLTFTFYSLV